MKIDKFPSRIQNIIEEFESKENQKRWRYLLTVGDKTLVVSRIEFNENTNETYLLKWFGWSLEVLLYNHY